MRILITFILVFWFNLVFGQSVYKIRMNLERVAINHNFPTIREERIILIVTQGRIFGMFDGYDTLLLEQTKPFPKSSVTIYKDLGHEDQLYYMMKVKTDQGFSIFIAPLKPYKRPRLYGINLSSI